MDGLLIGETYAGTTKIHSGLFAWTGKRRYLIMLWPDNFTDADGHTTRWLCPRLLDLTDGLVPIETQRLQGYPTETEALDRAVAILTTREVS